MLLPLTQRLSRPLDIGSKLALGLCVFLSLPSLTNATPQEDNPHLQQALAQRRAQPLAPQARNPGLVSLKDRHRVALPTSSGLEELCLGWRLSLLISP